MADAKISALPSATTPVGTEVLPLVQSGVTTKITIDAATGITRPFTANGVVYASSTTAQTTGSVLTFNGAILGVNGISIGRGAGAVATNTAVGASALGGGSQTGASNTAIGGNTLSSATSAAYNTAVGYFSGNSLTTGAGNTFVGSFQSGGTAGAGSAVTTGSKNVIIGGYTGSAAPISATGSNHIVFSDGDGNIRQSINGSGIVTMSAYGAGAATFSAAGVISSVSDETWKIKDGVPADPDAMLKKLEPGYWYYNDEKKETFGTERQLGFYAQNVNAAIGPEAAPEPTSYTDVDSNGNETTTTRSWGYYDRSVLAVTVMSLQKALATIESLTARIVALEAK
jgi:hypothetical protein